MPLQDIKYVMSVDDRQAQTSIRKAVDGFKSLDKSKFGGGREAADFSKILDGASGAMQQQSGVLAQIMADAVTGGLGSGVAAGAMGDLLSRSVARGSKQIAAAFGAAGNMGGAALAAGTAAVAVPALAKAGEVAGKAAADKFTLAWKASADKFFKAQAGRKLLDLKVGSGEAFADKLFPERMGKNAAGGLTAAFQPALASLSAGFARLGTVAVGALAGIGIAVGVVAGAFLLVANHARKLWSEVEDGIMRTQASLAGMGQSIQQAFSGATEEAILRSAETMANAYGVMAKETSASTAILVKNGMTLEQALSRQGLVANIAAVNKISQAEAAEKLIAAWNGETKALKEIGIRLDSTGDIAKDSALALQKVQERYGNPALSKPFIDDEPMKRASAALNMLWVDLGRALDPAFTAMAQSLSDILVGIAETLRDAGSSDFIPNLSGVIAAIGAVASTVVNAAAVVWNVFQMIFTVGSTALKVAWNGIQFALNWLQGKFAEILEWVGAAVSLIPGTGDAGANLQAQAAQLKESSAAAMAESGKAVGDALSTGLSALKTDAKDIGVALGPDGGAVGALKRKGQEATARAQEKATQDAKNAAPLGESEKVKEDRENKAKEAAEKRAKEEKGIFARNQRVEAERARLNNQRTVITLQTPQRMVAALRHGKKS